MNSTVTWHNVANAYDTFIGKLLYSMYAYPQDEIFLLKELVIAMARKKEAEVLAEEERQECYG